MRLRAVVGALLFAVACGGGEVVPTQVVQSVGWGPVQPTYDGVVRAWAKGAFENRGGSHAVTTGFYGDRAADGNPAYFCTQFMIHYAPLAGGAADWYQDWQSCTPEIASSGGDKPIQNVSRALSPKSTVVRGIQRACAQFGFPVPDPCASAIPSFNY